MEDETEEGKEGYREQWKLIKISWWNGGGKLIQRVTVNPVLKEFLNEKPDIFAYGESLIFRSTKELKLDGYKTIVHRAQIKGMRRGIVIYFKEKFANIITKEHTSNKYDIIWLRMKNSQDECIFAFFYAPGANHDEKKREEFYDELRKGIDRYKENKIYLLGDSNARLGEYSGDRDIKGKFQSNKNKALFIGLVEYTGLKYLNRIYEKGKPTYEIWGKKKLIIDVALTNNIKQIKNFKVMPQILGANAQTAHKIIKITLRAKVAPTNSERKKIQRFRHCSWEALIRVRGEVARK